MYYIGFDIGGSSIKAVLVENQKILKSNVSKLPNSLEGLFAIIINFNNELIKDLKNEIAGIGFALAADLDAERNNILRSYNVPYLDNLPIKKLLQEKLQFEKIKVEQDTPCFLLAESKVGVARELKNVFYFILGTGVGSAVMIDGRIIPGSHGAASEGGHMVLGKELDMEQLASNKLIEKILNITSGEAYKLACQGDEAARDAFLQLGHNLGIGIANIINILDPEAVILGGGVMRAKEFILPGIYEEIEKDVISPAARKTKILASELDIFGGALGAALLFD